MAEAAGLWPAAGRVARTQPGRGREGAPPRTGVAPSRARLAWALRTRPLLRRI